MRSDRIDGVLSFLGVLDRFKSVYRVSYLADGSRREGDADHAWHMCLFAMLLHGESDLKPDLRRVLELCLVHTTWSRSGPATPTPGNWAKEGV